jgi:hypothetical protein
MDYEQAERKHRKLIIHDYITMGCIGILIAYAIWMGMQDFPTED